MIRLAGPMGCDSGNLNDIPLGQEKGKFVTF